ncbi:MAG: BamA/TamA family outer membrane protein [Ignavibacteriales bacterium]|nr:BamA/TamA family outer membrane protein [Ignavibacteriales bacterium]
MKLRSFLGVVLLCWTSPWPQATAQTSQRVFLAADSSLLAGATHRFFFGDHWRTAWAMPIEVPLIDPQSAHSTFTPMHVEAPNLLPEELRVSFAGWIVRDQVSAFHPFATLIALPFAERLAVGTPPYSLAAERDSSTGRFILGYASPAQSYRSLTTDEVLIFTEANPRQRVDDVEYLKARLLDLFLGNAKRSRADWRWKLSKDSLQSMWKPMPADFDAAFSQFDGVIPALAALSVNQIEHVGKSFGSVEKLSSHNRALDRRLLGALTKQTWDSLSHWMQSVLTDAVIDSLIGQSRRLLTEQDQQYLSGILKARSRHLAEAANDYYRLMSESVEIYGTDQNDDVTVKRIGRHVLAVEMHQAGPPKREARRRDFGEINRAAGPLTYSRTFSDDYTSDVRIFLLGGDDVAVVEGESNNTFTVVVNGGTGRDTLLDRARSKSILGALGRLGRISAGPTIFDDTGVHDESVSLSNALLQNGNEEESTAKDWGSGTGFAPWLDVNPDDGLFVGGGPTWTRFGYRYAPYRSHLAILGGLATSTGRYRIDVSAAFHDWFDGARIRFQLHASQLDLSNYFGLGNETPFSLSSERVKFYKSDQQQVYVKTAVDFSSHRNLAVEISGLIKLVDNNPRPASFLSIQNPPFAHATLTFAAVSLHSRWDSRNDDYFPTTGALVDIELARVPGILDNPNSFTRLKCEARNFFTLPPYESILALRLAGEQLWGAHPFFESAFIGGNGSLRGFERQRFAGDASFTINAELRTHLATATVLVPLWMGSTVFAESGRVFLATESSSRWHGAAGAGCWISAIKKEYVLALSIARSEDQTAFYASLGFPF